MKSHINTCAAAVMTVATLTACSSDPATPQVEAYAGYTGQYDHFTLVLDERFDSFDAKVWERGDGAVGHEADCRFQPQGVEIRDGVMALTVRKESVAAGFSEDHQLQKRAYEFSCGEMRTVEKFKYGRIEARFKTPTTATSGFISSLFTYDRDDGMWREIDIELEGGRPGSMQSNLIFADGASDPDFAWIDTRAWGAWEKLHPMTKATSEWTVYAIEWTPDYIAWFMDGVEVRRLTNADLDNQPYQAPQVNKTWVPETDTKIMMNFWIPTRQVGVHFGGDPIDNAYPMTAEYDWFRYYAYTPK
ncbi:family 16 glycosylhydrolase [Neiella sp. HB171785]|uniref:Family 16 glycosylhydrolase n=1 Tax=Neiella litorisoli TaxID=2771431 RepID=A0A8J6QST2_9GAMM|nr:family 16 glycosylhydrolase [Neiella litorisoli]MBD1388072.1 family 16 glycosylhydrolase [Neiella litorisoli]